MSSVPSTTSAPDDFTQTHDEILAAIANVNTSAPSSSGLNPTSLTGEFSTSEGGFDDSLAGKDKDKHKRVSIVLLTDTTIDHTCCGFIGDKEAAFCL